MKRVTFGVSASFIANMCVKQNALDFKSDYPLAAQATDESFYVDDCLSGADDLQMAIKLQSELKTLFQKGGFKLHKWNSNSSELLQHIISNQSNDQNSQTICDGEKSTRTLGIEWITDKDEFRLTTSEKPIQQKLTKRVLVSDIACIFDVLGWFAPVIITMKVLLQRLWESGTNWDEEAPTDITSAWGYHALNGLS